MSNYLRDYYQESVRNNATIQRALSELSGSRCLITGANGIVGYALSRLLDAHTAADIVLATRTPYYKGKEYLSQNVTNSSYPSLTKQKFDFIFHCATHSQPNKFLSEWESTIQLSTNTLLDLLASTNVRLIFSSSTEIYHGLKKNACEFDNGTTCPQHERGAYIESKRVAEAACARSGIGRVSRIAPAAGPYASEGDTRVIFELIRRGRERGFICLKGGRINVRQYQYTGACVFRLLVSGVLGSELVYNNAGPYIYTLEDIGRSIATCMRLPYVVSEDSGNISGAADTIRVSMNRFHNEFLEMEAIDPPFDYFIKWLIEDHS
jgi:nucleoside-diphosphate-sugar epimerase